MTTPYEDHCTHKWDFNVTPVANISDSVGSITLTNHSCTSVPTGVNNCYCYNFNGSSYYLGGGTNTIGIGSGSFTIEIIFSENEAATYGPLLSRWRPISTKYYGWDFGYSNSAGYYRRFYSNYNGVTQFDIKENVAKSANQVFHWFITCDPAGGTDNYKFWEIQSGTPVNTKSGTYAGSPDESQSLNLIVGSRADLDYFLNGRIYLIRIHNAVLTTDQMTQNGAAERWRYVPPTTSSFVPYRDNCTHEWDFNRSDSGTVIDDVGSIAFTNVGATSTAAYNGAYNYYLEGTDDYLASGTASVGIGSGSFTLEVICALQTPSNSSALFSRSGTISSIIWGWRLSHYPPHIYFQTWYNNATTVNIPSSKTDWTMGKVYHFFITCNPSGGSNNYNLYWMNGTTPTNIGAATYAGSPVDSGNLTLAVGWNSLDSAYGKDNMYLIRVHNAVLTSDQMIQNYQAEGWRYGKIVGVTMPTPNCTTGVTTPASQFQVTPPSPSASTGVNTPVPQFQITAPVRGCDTGVDTPEPQFQIDTPYPGATTGTGTIAPRFYITMPNPPGAVADVGYVIRHLDVTMPVPHATTGVGSLTKQFYIDVPAVSAEADVGAITPKFQITMPIRGAVAHIGSGLQTSFVVDMPVPGASAGPGRLQMAHVPLWVPFTVKPSWKTTHIEYDTSLLKRPIERDEVIGNVPSHREVTSGLPPHFRIEANLTPEDIAKINLVREKLKHKSEEEEK